MIDVEIKVLGVRNRCIIDNVNSGIPYVRPVFMQTDYSKFFRFALTFAPFGSTIHHVMKNIFARKEIDMTEGPIFSKIMAFAFPLILTNLLQMLYNAADMVVVGRFSAVNGAVGAIGSTGALINLFTNLIMGASVGATVVVANAIGAKDQKRTERAVHTAIFIALICGFVGMSVGVGGARAVLEWMDADPALIDMSATYCRIWFLGLPVTTVLNYAIAIIRAKGDTTTPLIILSMSGILNVILNIFFVLGFGMDVDGVAIATVISTACATAAVMTSLIRDPGPCRFSFRKLRLHGTEARQIIAIGIPSGIQGTLFSISNVFIQQGINGFGAAVVTGNSIAGNLEGFLYTATNSIAQAALTFMGQNMGAKKYRRLPRITANSYLATILIAVVMSAIVYIFRFPLSHLYMNQTAENADRILATLDTRFNYMILPYFLLACMEVGSNIVRGMGRSVLSMVVSLAGSCAFRILWIHTIFAVYHRLEVLYISIPISWGMTALIHLCCVLVLQRKIIRSAEQEPVTA